MSHADLLTLLGLGLALGARHAFDADHVAAVATLLSRTPNLKLSGFIGLCWGLGHTIVVVAAGVSIIAFKITIPPPVSRAIEFGVGLMLVGLGVSLAVTLVRQRWHLHGHEHDGTSHWHVHSHRETPDHAHDHWIRFSLRPLMVGVCHGLAGSAALVLVVVSAVDSVWMAALYLLAFGLGSLVGMVAVALAISAPLVMSAKGGRSVWRAVQGLASVGSIGVGLAIMIEIGFGASLF